MTVTLRRLQLQGLLPEAPDFPDNLAVWLGSRTPDYYERLAENHTILRFEYSTLCAQLARTHHRIVDENSRRQRLETALYMAQMLLPLYRHYLGVRSEEKKLVGDINTYRTLLGIEGREEVQPSWMLSGRVRWFWRQCNFPRLLSSRARRAVIAVEDVAHKLAPYSVYWQKFSNSFREHDVHYGLATGIIAFAFFVPRLVVNLYLLTKHLIGTDEKEREIGFLSRLDAQMQRRGFELFNDTAWFVAGILGFTLFTGALGPAGVYFTLAMFAYDTMLASIRAWVESRRIRELIANYEAMRGQEGVDEHELNEMLADLENQYYFERKRLGLGVANTFCLLTAMVLLLPCFASTPILPLVGASLIIALTVANFIADYIIGTQKPSESLQELQSVVANNDNPSFDEDDPVPPYNNASLVPS